MIEIQGPRSDVTVVQIRTIVHIINDESKIKRGWGRRIHFHNIYPQYGHALASTRTPEFECNSLGVNFPLSLIFLISIAIR